jgi:adenine/guanine phosphoribosyltransferase-like PRPP-binding protein
MIEGGRVQVLGRISLETLEFRASIDESDWRSHPLYVRVNIVLDFDLSLISVGILDVPPEIRGASVQGPFGWMRLSRDAEEESLDLDEFFKRENIPNTSYRSLDAFLSYFEGGRMRIRFESDPLLPRSELDEANIADLLFRLGVVERDGPYWLPDNLRTDTYINIGKLCRHNFAIEAIATALHDRFARERFDCIVAHGWAMGAIGRRLAEMRGRCGKQPEDIVCIGYDPPMLMADILPESRVLLLVDVVVSGHLVRELERRVIDLGAAVAGVGAVVCADSDGIRVPHGIQSLCSITMRLGAGAKDHRSAAPAHEWVFNPFSCTMTKCVRESRSPSEFLQENHEVASFWRLVDQVDAYQLHKKEGNSHYIAFVDTLQLLQAKKVGDELVEELCQRVEANFADPDLVLVPGKRARGRILGQRVVRRLVQSRRGQPVMVVASWGKGRWRIQPQDLAKFPNSRVLVVDTAIGHGRTIESLCNLAASLQATGVGAAVLISRLPESGEVGLDHRLPDGFISLYHLPIQPFVIRGSRKDLCPVCAEKAAVRSAMREEWGRGLFDQWEKWLSRLPVTRTGDIDSGRLTRERREQLTLFPSATHAFLKHCRPKTAGAITLHSLGAAKMNGMASLVLPELQDSGLTPRVKAAMVEHLPPRVLEWSGTSLERELEEVLATSDRPGLWRATARVMARERYSQWYEYLGEALQRFQQLRREPSGVFWGSMIWNAFVNCNADSEAANSLRGVLSDLLVECQESSERSGIERMLIAVGAQVHEHNLSVSTGKPDRSP